jgi:hypothetical protein
MNYYNIILTKNKKLIALLMSLIFKKHMFWLIIIDQQTISLWIYLELIIDH